MAIVVAERVSKYYGAHAAVSDLSFSVDKGEVVGLLGLNGAGKTTTLRVLSGMLIPTSGRITIAGINMEERPQAARSRIGFLPEMPPVYPEMTVEAYVKFVARINGVTARSELRQALEGALSATGLQEVRKSPIGTLSHGFQKRVGIAQAIAHAPPLILLDEPTSGLDPMQIVHMRALIKRLRGKHTILISSHILSEIQQLCDRIIVLREGRIEAQGSEAELAEKVLQATRLRVEVRGEAAHLEQVLLKMPTLVHHHIDSQGFGFVQATAEFSTDAREDLAQQIVHAGLGLRALESAHSGLEGIFLKLTSDAGSTSSSTNGLP